MVAEAFWKNWWSTFGAPVEVVHDQGRAFSQELQGHLERCGASVRIKPTDTLWHNSLVGRHGQVMGEIVESSVRACRIEDYDEMKLATIPAASAKNRMRTEPATHQDPESLVQSDGQERSSTTFLKARIQQSFIEQCQIRGQASP